MYTAINNETGDIMAMKELPLQPNDHKTLRNVAEELRIFESIRHKHLINHYGVEVSKKLGLLKDAFMFYRMSNLIFDLSGVDLYRVSLKDMYVVARVFFLLLLNWTAWPLPWSFLANHTSLSSIEIICRVSILG